MNRLLLSALLGAGLCLAATDIVVHAKPPHAVHEHPTAAPGEGYVWLPGYQKWDGERYVWQTGHWEKPPHEHAIWMVPRWEKRQGGYVFMDGWWD